MKTSNRTCFLGLALLLAQAISAQSEKSAVKTLIESKRFIFHAQTALPLGGRSRQLTTEYSLRVSSDSLVSNLPFYGKAYSVPYGTGGGGFDFTSTKFEYTAAPGKKKGWNISIKPKDVMDFREFSLSLSDDGYGTLQALTNNRSPMSFTGYITPVK